jgi:hypothetical protein
MKADAKANYTDVLTSEQNLLAAQLEGVDDHLQQLQAIAPPSIYIPRSRNIPLPCTCTSEIIAPSIGLGLEFDPHESGTALPLLASKDGDGSTGMTFLWTGDTYRFYIFAFTGPSSGLYSSNSAASNSRATPSGRVSVTQ